MTGTRVVPRCDVLVVGGGAAGLAAAAEAARIGLSAVLVDEQPWPGLAAPAEAARAAGADLRFGVSLWGVAPSWRAFLAPVDPTRGDVAPEIEARALVIATGAVEEPLALPGWTLPGAIAGRAARRLLAQGAPVGERVGVVGRSDRTAHLVQSLEAGATAAVHVAAPPDEGVAPSPSPVPLAMAIEGREAVEALRVATVRGASDDRPGRTEIWPVDTVVLAGPLAPLTELVQLCGAPLVYAEGLGGFVPLCGPDLQTPVDAVFVCGSAAGVEPSSLAPLQGRLAGRAAAARVLGPAHRDAARLCDEARAALGAGRTRHDGASDAAARAREAVAALWARRA